MNDAMKAAMAAIDAATGHDESKVALYDDGTIGLYGSWSAADLRKIADALDALIEAQKKGGAS